MSVSNRIQHVQKLIRETCEVCNRPADDVQIIAVSKGQPADAIREAFQAGLVNFGENYWQEARLKMAELQDLPIIWHFIGAVQSNKTMDIAQHFSWVHGINSTKTAGLLAAARPLSFAPLNGCIQINLDREPSKSGIRDDEFDQLASSISRMSQLTLRGLMAIPKLKESPEAQYDSFHHLFQLLHTANKKLSLSMDTLSMGMSDDFIPAIRAGSTMLRIGRAIFGERL